MIKDPARTRAGSHSFLCYDFCMKNFFKNSSVRTLASLVAAVSFILVAVLGGFEIYVRWTLNQNFTFLGGWGFEAITLGAFALLIALLFSRRE
jgi:hypothetical protein